MKKALLAIALLLSINLWADLITEGYAQIEKGNAKKGSELLAKACENGNAQGCFSLGYMYKNGSGIEQDTQKTIALWERACKLDDSNGCIKVAMLYEKGRDIKQDHQKAKELLHKACDLGDSLGCELLKELAAPEDK